MTKLAEIMRQTMRDDNLDERAMAAAIGVTRAVVRTALAGGEPDLPHLKTIAAYYQRSLAWAIEQLGYDAGGGDASARIAALVSRDERLAPLLLFVAEQHPDDVPYLLSVLEAAASRRSTRQ